MKCRATSKRTGQKCGAQAVTGSDLCYHHGGKSKVGFALPQTKTGMYSKHLPTRLAATYAETISDKNLWELTEKAGLVNARIVELISKLDTGETGATWKKLKSVWVDLQTAMRQQDSATTILLIHEMTRLIDAGNKDYLAWAEITEQIETYRKLSESERKHQEAESRMVTAEQVMLMIAAITDIVRQNVTDRNQLSAISAGITRLISIDASK